MPLSADECGAGSVTCLAAAIMSDIDNDNHVEDLTRSSSTSMIQKPPLHRKETLAEEAADILKSAQPAFMSYLYGTIATGIKTFAWWLNQWPGVKKWNFGAKWVVSASTAGFEYLPLTMAMQTANKYDVHLGLLTAYMEAADNFLRMMQQVGLGDPLAWYDWLAAVGLGVCVAWQGGMHYSADKQRRLQAEEAATLAEASTVDGSAGADIPDPEITVYEAQRKSKRERIILLSTIVFFTTVGSIIGAAVGGPWGQAYVLATIATAAKTFAWWVNQYPQLKHLSFVKKWLAGWSIAALIEYLPLIGAFTIASEHDVHLGLMTAYMEALDNFFRICQQKLLEKPLAWYDLTAAAGMFVCVIFQGVMRYQEDRNGL